MTGAPDSRLSELQLSLTLLMANKQLLTDLSVRAHEDGGQFGRLYDLVQIHTAIELVNGLISEISAGRQQNAARLCRHVLELELEDAYVSSSEDGIDRWMRSFAIRWRRSTAGIDLRPQGQPFDAVLEEAEAHRKGGLPHYQDMAEWLERGSWWRLRYGRLSRIAHPGFGGLSVYIRPAPGVTRVGLLKALDEGQDPDRLFVVDPTSRDDDFLDTIATYAHGALSHFAARATQRLETSGR